MNLSLLNKLMRNFLAITCIIILGWSHVTFSEESATQNKLSSEDVKLIQSNAENGDAQNQYILGILYQRGGELTQNSEKAAEWYLKAANQQYAPAELAIGMLYDAGSGVEKNDQAAYEWYSKAAKQGLPDAQYNLAVMYDQGRGTEKNYAEAAKWYELSARQGYTNAQVNLGGMYSEGDGVSQDYQKAYVWMSAAAQAGNKSAEFKTKWLSNKMNEKELATAKATAEACFNSNFSVCGS